MYFGRKWGQYWLTDFLLSQKDYSVLVSAYRSRRSGVILEREFPGKCSLRISMGKPSRPWGRMWLVRLETQRGNMYTSQYFESVEELKSNGI